MKDDKHINECLGCRLVTGFGAIGIGVYIFTQARRRRKPELLVMNTLAAGTIGIGICRLLNLNFLKSKKL